MPKSNAQRQAAFRKHRDEELRLLSETNMTLVDHVVKLHGALKPFANIIPSSLYPADGSEIEEYIVLLRGPYDNPLAFTGLDLAIAKEVYYGVPALPSELRVEHEQLKFFCAILLAVSENRTKNLEALEDFIANLKKASHA